MDKIEKIRNELERRIALYSGWSNETVHPTRIDEDKQLLSFLDILEEEPDKSLEEAAEKSLRLAGFHNMETRGMDWKGGFIAGAEWQTDHLKRLSDEQE